VATAEEIQTWLAALEARVIEIGLEMEEIRVTIRDDDLDVPEQLALYDKLVQVKMKLREIGKS
jgi:hypothetical protein